MSETDRPRPPSRLRGNIAFALVSLSFGILGVYGTTLLGVRSELWGYRHDPTPHPQPSFEVLLWITGSLPVFFLYVPLVHALILQRLSPARRFRGYLIALAPIVVPIALLAISNSPYFLLEALLVAVLAVALFEYVRWIDAAPYRAAPATAAATITLVAAGLLSYRMAGYSPLEAREPASPWTLLILPLALVLPVGAVLLASRLFRPTR